MRKTKKIEKLYNQFSTEKQIKNPKLFSNIVLIFGILLVSTIIIGIGLCIFYLSIKYVPIKELKLKVLFSIIIVLILFYGLLYILNLLFENKIKKYNLELKNRSTNKNFLEWLLKKKLKKENIEFKEKYTDKKTYNEVIIWIIGILISGGFASYIFSSILEYYNQSLEILKQKNELLYMGSMLIIPLFKDNKNRESIKKKLLEKRYLELSDYVKKYFENIKILEKFLIIDVKNKELILKNIDKNKLSEIEKKLEKVGYIRKKSKLIFFIKFEYLEIFLYNLISHTEQKKEKQEQLKEKIVNKINNLDYIYMNQEKIIKLVIEIKKRKEDKK